MPKIVKKYGKITLVLGLILLLVGMYVVITPVKAATYCTKEKDVLSDSRPSTPSTISANHTIQFVTPTGVDASTDTITITFPTGWGMGTFALLNFDLAVDTTDPIGDCASFVTEKTLAVSPGASPIWGVGQSGQIVTFTAPTDAASGEIAAGSCVQIEIGSNATAGGGGATQLTNHATAASYSIDIGGVFGDTGKAMVAVISGVTVSATVAETLSFSIGARTTGQCTGDTGSPTVVATTAANAVDFGTLTVDAFTVACHLLTVSTNANSGYAVTCQEDDQLTNGTNDIPDTTCDGTTCTESTAATWATATGNDGFGLGCEHGTGSPCDSMYGAWSTYKYAQFASIGDAETAHALMSETIPVSSDTATIHYKISVSGTQQPGTYTNTIVYIATPTY